MRIKHLILMITLLLPNLSTAESPTTWKNATSVPGWEAVGRLTISGHTMCTGALVAPDLVLTAAHCLYNPQTGKRVAADRISFQAALAEGRALATRQVVSAVQDAQYRYKPRGQAQVGHDLALLKLDRPISHKTVPPLGFESRPEKGDMLSVIAYTIGNKTDPSVAFPCKVLARQHETLVMSCPVDFGASGAPVFAFRGGQRPSLVSVISSKAAMNGKDVSVGTTLDTETLRRLMREG